VADNAASKCAKAGCSRILVLAFVVISAGFLAIIERLCNV
jgi:hypothetical protein